MTSNYKIVSDSEAWSTFEYLALNHCLLFSGTVPCMQLSSMDAVDTQMKSMHKQGVGKRSEPHSLYMYYS